MNIKKHILAVSFLIFSFFCLYSTSSAACSLQNLKECDRAGLISVIMDLIKSKKLPVQNEFTVDKMKTKLNQNVGGMKLVAVESSKESTSFRFEGEVDLNADFSNNVLFLGSRGPSDQYFCFFSINDADSKKIPRIVLKDENDIDIRNYLCVRGNLKEFPRNSYGNANIRINKLTLTVNNSNKVDDRRSSYCADYQDYVSIVNVVEMKKVRNYDVENKETWRTFNYSFDDGSVLQFSVQPNYDFHINENGFVAYMNKNGRCSDFGDFDTLISLTIEKNKNLPEYFNKTKAFENEFYNFNLNKMRATSSCGHSLSSTTLIEKGYYLLETSLCPDELVNNILFANSKTSSFNNNTVDCLGSNMCNQIMDYGKIYQ